MFDAILGHDLRGPLSTITLAGELLTRNELRPDKARELGLRVQGAARYMTAMVSDLLEFARSRLGGAKLPVTLEMEDLVEVCKAAIVDAQAMHPHCAFEFVADAPVSGCVDADRIHQLLVNLLGNAGQHGAPGRPVEMRVAGDDNEAVLCVVNEGSQIPATSLKRIFEPMVQLKPHGDSSNSVATSLGLGLHIAREIAQAHGGSITAESDELRTTFTVRLPRREVESSTRLGGRAQAPRNA
jgi:signal transduction histidine kinase